MLDRAEKIMLFTIPTLVNGSLCAQVLAGSSTEPYVLAAIGVSLILTGYVVSWFMRSRVRDELRLPKVIKSPTNRANWDHEAQLDNFSVSQDRVQIYGSGTPKPGLSAHSWRSATPASGSEDRHHANLV